jgi:hypothetical protein
MMFSQTITVYREAHSKHTRTLYGQNVEFSYVKAGDT